MATYPTPKQALAGSGGQFGPPYMKYLKVRKDYSEITLISTFEDKGVDTNESATDVPQRWEFFYDGLTESQAKILDDFWDAHRLSQSFTFVEPRDAPWTEQEGDTYTSVRFESYEKDHGANLTQNRTVVLVKYPS